MKWWLCVLQHRLHEGQWMCSPAQNNKSVQRTHGFALVPWHVKLKWECASFGKGSSSKLCICVLQSLSCINADSPGQPGRGGAGSQRLMTYSQGFYGSVGTPAP